MAEIKTVTKEDIDKIKADLKKKNAKKISVKEFWDKYNKAKTDEAKEKLLNDVMNVHYVPYEMKLTICKKIVETTYYITSEKDGIKSKKLHIDSPSEYMLYNLNLVDYYTNIKVNFKDVLKEFNMLNEKILDNIIALIPDKELKEFRMILSMVENDIIQNEYEPHAFIRNQVERFGDLVGVVLKPAIERFTDVVKDLKLEDIGAILDAVKRKEE